MCVGESGTNGSQRPLRGAGNPIISLEKTVRSNWWGIRAIGLGAAGPAETLRQVSPGAPNGVISLEKTVRLNDQAGRNGLKQQLHALILQYLQKVK